MSMRWSQTTLQVTRDIELWCKCMQQADGKQLKTLMASSFVREKNQSMDIRGDISYCVLRYVNGTLQSDTMSLLA